MENGQTKFSPNTAADFDFKSQTQQRDLVNFGIGGAAKFICWNVFVLTSFQILCTKLVHVEPSFVFPNYFADF